MRTPAASGVELRTWGGYGPRVFAGEEVQGHPVGVEDGVTTWWEVGVGEPLWSQWVRRQLQLEPLG